MQYLISAGPGGCCRGREYSYLLPGQLGGISGVDENGSQSGTDSQDGEATIVTKAVYDKKD